MELRTVATPLLDIGYFEAGDSNGPVAVLLHGFPYDAHACVEAGDLLAAEGWHVLAPWLRGFGPTTFRSPSTVRSGEQAALGSDLVAFLDALNVERATFAGYDWGGRAACVVAALWPERVAGLITAFGYNIFLTEQMIKPGPPDEEANRWFCFYFHSPRGEAGLRQYTRPLLRQIWEQASPKWRLDDATFDRTATAYENPDFVSVVIHSYRHRYGMAPGDPQYAELEERLSSRPVIDAPTVVLICDSDGFLRKEKVEGDDAISDWRPDTSRFTHLISTTHVDGGHSMTQENPKEVVAAFRLLSERVGS